MESLEIGMTWNASPYAPRSDDSSRQLGTPDQRVLLSTEDSRAGPSNAIQHHKVTATPTSDMLDTVGREEVMKGEQDAHEKEGQVSKGLESITSKSIKKRKMKLGIGEDILDRFGPPRQSVRARIKVEFQTPPEPPTEIISPKSKKVKNLKRSVMTDPAQVSKVMEMCETDKGRKRMKDSKSRTANKEKKSILTEIRPSMMLTEDDMKADEIIAHRPVSLESMGTAGAVTKTNGRTLEQRLQEKKRKDRKIIVSEPKEDSDADIPLVEIGSLDDPGPIPVKRGIQSSTFARVMRLVADLPRCEVKPKTIKRLVPEHRPLVWAMSRQELCEALPYYRAFQSGLYLHQGVAFGYLLDGFPAPRDACAHNARVIISHGGGYCVRPTLDDGQVLPPVLAGDQLVTDFRVATLVRAWQRRVPLVLIAGSGYELLPFKLNCSYAVLGWYWVSMVWTEAEPVAQGIKPPIGRGWFKRVKVRFDWVESQGIPWWEQSAGPAPQQTNSYEEAIASPEAKRIQVSELVCAESDQKDMGDLDHRPASTFFGVLPGQTLRPLYPFNPKSGLLTPPITPPTLSSHTMLTAETTRLTEGNVAKLNETKRRRLPGDYLLAAVKGKVDMKASVDPYNSIRKQCQYCRGDNPIIYAEGWMCLNTKCTAYWMLNTNIGLLPVPPGLKLSYHPQYLKPVPTPRDVKPAYDVVPPRPKSGIPDEAGPGDSAGSRSLWRGWVCENCGRANCRFRWEVWQCLGCKKLLAPIDPYSAVIPAGSLGGPEKAMLGDPKIDSSARISVSMRRIQDPAATVMIYTLPDRIGTVYHVINDCNDFADGIFDRYQREAASTRVPLFQRRPLNAHQIRGQLLAQHFAVNSGVSYKYNVDSLSLSFDDSPSCVIQALDAITLRTERVLGSKIDFNEVLSVLYREGQKMSWHDDGEPGLGPVVAGLSLGSSATISWRRKSAHTHANASFNKGMPDPRKEPISPIALSLTTSHGDIVMMEGREMQKKYVHRVIPNGFRVAATARVIGK